MRSINILAFIAVIAACSDDPAGEPCFTTTIPAATCDPSTSTFSLGSTNVYYPLLVGSEVVLEGTEDGMNIRVEGRVLADTEVVDGVTTHVLEARELIDGELYEVARNFYVEAGDGTVCYFGEDVEFYEDGVVVNQAGSWRAGIDGAKPGVIMPAIPAVGQAYFQENAPGVAEDMGRVTIVDGTLSAAGQSWTDVVTIKDSNPIDPDAACEEEPKRYAPGVGEVLDTGKIVISLSPGA